MRQPFARQRGAVKRGLNCSSIARSTRLTVRTLISAVDCHGGRVTPPRRRGEHAPGGSVYTHRVLSGYTHRGFFSGIPASFPFFFKSGFFALRATGTSSARFGRLDGPPYPHFGLHVRGRAREGARSPAATSKLHVRARLARIAPHAPRCMRLRAPVWPRNAFRGSGERFGRAGLRRP